MEVDNICTLDSKGKSTGILLCNRKRVLHNLDTICNSDKWSGATASKTRQDESKRGEWGEKGRRSYMHRRNEGSTRGRLVDS